MKPLSICAIIRDEAPYIAEWIAFHRTVGVSRFFIYDDRSTDNTLDICRMISDGDIIIHPYEEGWHSPTYCGVRGRHRRRAVITAFRTQTFGLALPKAVRRTVTPQSCAYRHCDAHHKNDTFWCAFIDIDEYLFHDEIDCLPKFLESYENYSGVAVNWLIFGSNGHQIRPSGLTIENYTRRKTLGGPHRNHCGQTKHILRMDAPHNWGRYTPHSPNYEQGYGVNQQFIPTAKGFTDHPTDSGLRLHHYCHRSHAEKTTKVANRVGWSTHSPLYRMHEFDCNDMLDESALILAERVRADLQRHGLQPYHR